MRKVADFVIYPLKPGQPVTIQSDNRIASVNLETKKAWLSNGKGGHQGFMKLQPILGAVEVDVPDEVIEELKKQIASMEGQRVAEDVPEGMFATSFRI
jgi:hypothetical protein